jgi:hypothetical protein
LTEIVDEHMPRKQMLVREQDVPFMIIEWKEAMRARRRAAKRYRKTNSLENWELLRKLQMKRQDSDGRQLRVIGKENQRN